MEPSIKKQKIENKKIKKENIMDDEKKEKEKLFTFDDKLFQKHLKDYHRNVLLLSNRIKPFTIGLNNHGNPVMITSRGRYNTLCSNIITKVISLYI